MLHIVQFSLSKFSTLRERWEIRRPRVRVPEAAQWMAHGSPYKRSRQNRDEHAYLALIGSRIQPIEANPTKSKEASMLLDDDPDSQ